MLNLNSGKFRKPVALTLCLLTVVLVFLAQAQSKKEEKKAAFNGAAGETMAIAPPQIFGADLNGVCPSGCSIPITINSVENLLTSDGRKVKVNWQVGQVPGDLKATG